MTNKITITAEARVELEARAKAYQTIVDTPILDRFNKIVEVGALTIFCSDDKDTLDGITLKNSIFPTQLSEKAVEGVLKLKFTSDLTGEVIEPKVFDVKEWYKDSLEMIEMLLNL